MWEKLKNLSISEKAEHELQASAPKKSVSTTTAISILNEVVTYLRTQSQSSLQSQAKRVVSMVASELPYCQSKMSFQLQVCLDDWEGCRSGAGFIKHWRKLHSDKDMQFPTLKCPSGDQVIQYLESKTEEEKAEDEKQKCRGEREKEEGKRRARKQ